jgi:hypothetical protein
MLKSTLSFFLIILLFLSTLGYTAKSLENPEFLVEQSRKANLYGRLTNQVQLIVPKETQEATTLSKEEMTEIIITVIDAETFYTVLEEYLTAVMGYLKGSSDGLQFSYSLTSIKQKAADEITQKALAKYAALPVCGQKELSTWDPEKEFPTCKLPEGNVKDNDIERIFKKSATEGVANLPEAISVTNPSESLKSARGVVMRTNQIVTIVWGLTALIVALMLLLLRAKAFRPLAVTFIIVGLLQIGFSLIAWDWIARAVGELFSGSDAAAVAPIIADIVATVLEILKTTLGNISIVTLGIGVMFLVLAIVHWFHRPKEQSQKI